MKILYLTNIEVPYRVMFFNELAKHCDLTVMYERTNSATRDTIWAKGNKKTHNVEYLDGINLGNESTFSARVCQLVNRGWDVIIVGCYNSRVQMLAMLYMRWKHIPFYINLDGEPFIEEGISSKIKKYFILGAKGYLVAREKACASLQRVLAHKKNGSQHISDAQKMPIEPYYFSSLTTTQIKSNGQTQCERGQTILVIGQYLDRKGMDVAFKSACMDKSISYKFVGMGERTEMFIKKMGNFPSNIEIVPFLQKPDLEEEYKRCAMLLLPSRKECWGLVVNEAASFGTPIVSTWGSGAAVEFLADNYPQYLAMPGDAKSLLKSIRLCLTSNNTEYSEYLKTKSSKYSIKRNVETHIQVLLNCQKY